MALANQPCCHCTTLAWLVSRVSIVVNGSVAYSSITTENKQSLSKDFLSCKAARMLMLADTDRLDVDLTTGHMQGKFQLVLISNAGHSLMEDAPMAVARHIHDFAVRHCTPNDVLRQANAQLRQQAKK